MMKDEETQNSFVASTQKDLPIVIKYLTNEYTRLIIAMLSS